MTTGTSERSRQAREELGRTEVGRGTVWVMTIVFCTFLSSVAAEWAFTRAAVGRGRTAAHTEAPGQEMRDLLGSVREAMVLGVHGRLREGNRLLQTATGRFEDTIERDALMRTAVRPVVQTLFVRYLGLGNEQVYIGRENWLVFRDDFDYVTGPGFLDENVGARRRREVTGGDDPIEPDPIAAIIEFRDELLRHKIELIVVPVPNKVQVHPGLFTGRCASDCVGLDNHSFEPFVRRLEATGIRVFDTLSSLASAERPAGEHLFLSSDTHWNPLAVESVAAELAAYVRSRFELPADRQVRYRRRSVLVENRGDLAAMLGVLEEASVSDAERVIVNQIYDDSNRLWERDPGADILLLGDSFTNVFSQSELGWGAGAGLAEQLSYALERPVDRVSVNAGGAFSTRLALQRQLLADPSRLAGKRLVIYQFAVRELAQGDWKRIPLTADRAQGSRSHAGVDPAR